VPCGAPTAVGRLLSRASRPSRGYHIEPDSAVTDIRSCSAVTLFPDATQKESGSGSTGAPGRFSDCLQEDGPREIRVREESRRSTLVSRGTSAGGFQRDHLRTVFSADPESAIGSDSYRHLPRPSRPIPVGVFLLEIIRKRTYMTDQRRLELCGISIGGLNPSARERIEVIGFDAWLDEAAGVGTVSPIGDMIKPIAASAYTWADCHR
jgi:hypothetical protein